MQRNSLVTAKAALAAADCVKCDQNVSVRTLRRRYCSVSAAAALKAAAIRSAIAVSGKNRPTLEHGDVLLRARDRRPCQQ